MIINRFIMQSEPRSHVDEGGFALSGWGCQCLRKVLRDSERDEDARPLGASASIENRKAEHRIRLRSRDTTDVLREPSMNNTII